MNCEHANVLISKYIDGSIDFTEARLLEEHCSTCAECSLVLSLCKSADTSVDENNFVPDFNEKVMEKVEKAYVKLESKKYPRMVLASVFITFGIAAIVGFMRFSQFLLWLCNLMFGLFLSCLQMMFDLLMNILRILFIH